VCAAKASKQASSFFNKNLTNADNEKKRDLLAIAKFFVIRGSVVMQMSTYRRCRTRHAGNHSRTEAVQISRRLYGNLRVGTLRTAPLSLTTCIRAPSPRFAALHSRTLPHYVLHRSVTDGLNRTLSLTQTA